MSTHKKKEPPSLFNKDDFSYWKKEWKDMPEFKMKELNSEFKIIVHFKNKKDMESFSKLVNQKILTTTQSIWYPEAKIETYADKLYIDEEE